MTATNRAAPDRDNTTQGDSPVCGAQLHRLLDIAALNAEMLQAEAEELQSDDAPLGELLSRLANTYASAALGLIFHTTPVTAPRV